MSASISLLRTKVADYTRDRNFRVRSINQVDRAINSTYSDIQQELEWYIDEQQTAGTIAGIGGQEQYDLPDGFQTLQVVTWDTIPLIRRTKANIIKNSRGVINGSPIYYYLRGNKIGLYPVPVESKTIYLEYTERLPTITDLQDAEGSDVFTDIIALWAAIKLFRQVRKPSEDLQAELQKLKDLAIYTLRKDDNLRYGDQQSNGDFANPRGLGYNNY